MVRLPASSGADDDCVEPMHNSSFPAVKPTGSLTCAGRAIAQPPGLGGAGTLGLVEGDLDAEQAKMPHDQLHQHVLQQQQRWYVQQGQLQAQDLQQQHNQQQLTLLQQQQQQLNQQQKLQQQILRQQRLHQQQQQHHQLQQQLMQHQQARQQQQQPQQFEGPPLQQMQRVQSMHQQLQEQMAYMEAQQAALSREGNQQDRQQRPQQAPQQAGASSQQQTVPDASLPVQAQTATEQQEKEWQARTPALNANIVAPALAEKAADDLIQEKEMAADCTDAASSSQPAELIKPEPPEAAEETSVPAATAPAPAATPAASGASQPGSPSSPQSPQRRALPLDDDDLSPSRMAVKKAQEGTFMHSQVWPDGREYIGQWYNGGPQGDGRMMYPNSDCYTGQWLDHLRHGEGTLQRGFSTTDESCMYRGQWSGGLQHGRGVEAWPDGSRYEGNYRHGELYGEGVFILPSGAVRRVVN